MAGKEPTPVKPAAPPSASSSKSRPKQLSEAKVRPAPKSGKSFKEKKAAAKQKRSKPEPEEGAKRKKQQAYGDTATPSKERKKRDEPGTKPLKVATPTKNQQSPGKSVKPAPPAKKQQSSGKGDKPAPTPTKKQQSPSRAQKPAAAATTPTKKQQASGGAGKSTPTKRKRGDAEFQKEARSPNRASGDGDARAPTPVKKKRRDQKAAAIDKGACRFPMARVRQLMRAEDATIRASNEAVFLINKASELFLEKFAEDAYRNALKDRKKSIIYDNLYFVPQRVTAQDALKATALTQS
ncbi:DNA polymerase II subunit B3-1-like isoform X2 [Phragmites australis]|uniref:DNA polymerase II subunit B3-1-like isoform X2 n=1 Tax=Phragmites australis TaxID=29695 RepID=UPI002D76937A|nr:DNA polymerase II subunit B3-1-like isoform X2 [Phragmites australis]